MTKAGAVPSLPGTQKRRHHFIRAQFSGRRQVAGGLETPTSCRCWYRKTVIDNCHETPESILYTKTLQGARDVAQLAENLPSIHKALQPIPNTPQTSMVPHAYNLSIGYGFGGSEFQS